MSILIKNITKTFGEQKALDEVSFEISKGEIAGFIGPNGAGKSTLMKIITGFIPATKGDINVSGLDVMEYPLQIRKKVGYLPENNPLYPEMYVKEYLHFIAGLYKLGKETKSRVSAMIEKTGLTVEQNKKISALSKGYRQRVGIAQVLIHDPEILILDEPTSGLDPNQIVEIRNLIQEIGQEKTVMLSTHIMQEVEAICDRIIIINKGKIVANDLRQQITNLTKENTVTIQVEFSKTIDKSELDAIEGVIKTLNIGENHWLIQSGAEKDIRTDIFNFAVKNSNSVLSMQRKEKTLEKVFQELTK